MIVSRSSPRRGDPSGRPLDKNCGFAETGEETYPLLPGDRKGRPYYIVTIKTLFQDKGV